MKFLIALLFLHFLIVDQEDPHVYARRVSFPEFINDTANVIRGNVKSLDRFFEQLYTLRVANDSDKGLVSILHVGDSHLQAGFLNGAVMRNFHRDFGNAGRGLIVPLKLTKTNEPYDYDIQSNVDWIASRCLSSRPKYPVGIGGISIATRSSSFRLDISVSGRDEEDYRFNKVNVYHYPTTPVLHPELKDGMTVTATKSPCPFVTTFSIDRLVRNISFTGENLDRDTSIYYGFSLENGKSGVLYHSIGINGAQFIHYANIDNFLEQVNEIAPELIIFSLGTNEAFRGNFDKVYLLREMDRVVLPVKKSNPHAAIILTTPPECQYKVRGNNYVPNPYIQQISEVIIEYALKHDCAYWDLFGISGGKNSSEEWIKAEYLAKDKIHFAIAGYRVQANMFYQAILKSYNKYVDTRFRKIDFIVPIPLRRTDCF